MGNNQENNNENIGKLKMQIYLNKFNFFPGETIKGFLELSPKEEDSKDSKILNNIKLYYALIHKECFKDSSIKPKEKSKEINSININNDSDFDDYNSETIFSKREIYNDNKNSQNFVKIPFQMKIPMETKPSFEFSRSNKLSDSYGYSRVYLDIEVPEYLSKKEILIFIEKHPSPLKSELTITKYITKKKLGFIGSGSNINFQGTYPKNYYGFSETCPLNISLDIFGSKENVNGIEFTLKRKVSFMKNKSKVAEEYVDDLWQSNMKENNLSKNITFNLPLIEPDKFIKERKSPYFDINTINKENLICLLPSYDSNLIKCKYYILIKIFYDSMLIKNPEFEMPIDLGHTNSIFNQTFILDINKILGKINQTLILSLMEENNSDNINNKKEVDMKSKMKDIFGESSQKNKNKQENMNKIFGNIPPQNINKPIVNKKEETPNPQNSININNNINNNVNNNSYSYPSLENSNGNLSGSGSLNLPSKEEVYSTQDEQAAPGLDKNP